MDGEPRNAESDLSRAEVPTQSATCSANDGTDHLGIRFAAGCALGLMSVTLRWPSPPREHFAEPGDSVADLRVGSGAGQLRDVLGRSEGLTRGVGVAGRDLGVPAVAQQNDEANLVSDLPQTGFTQPQPVASFAISPLNRQQFAQAAEDGPLVAPVTQRAVDGQCLVEVRSRLIDAALAPEQVTQDAEDEALVAAVADFTVYRQGSLVQCACLVHAALIVLQQAEVADDDASVAPVANLAVDGERLLVMQANSAGSFLATRSSRRRAATDPFLTLGPSN